MHDADARTWMKIRNPRDQRASMQWTDERGARIRLLSSTPTCAMHHDGTESNTAPPNVQAAPTN